MNKLEELNLKYCENPDYYILLEMDSLNVFHADIEKVPEELILLLEVNGYDKRNIRAGLRNGTVTKEALRTAAGNIINAVLNGTKIK